MMPVIRNGLLCAGLAIALGGCATTPEPSLLRPQAAAGWRYARAVCGRCHAVDATMAGRNPHAASFLEIASAYDDYRLSMEFDALGRSGHFEMGRFVAPPKERKALTAYLMRLREVQARKGD